MNNEQPIRVLRIVEGTSVDGPGLRTSIYVAGCHHHCPDCHNPQSWDFESGTPMTIQEIMDVVRYNGYGVTLTGGDPIYSAEALLPLVKAIHEELPLKPLWVYTGFTFEELQAHPDPSVREFLHNVDILVDGPFKKEQRNIELRFRGSENQRIIRVKPSLEQGRVVLWED